MTKPDDIPQDIWDAAVKSWNSIYYTLMEEGGPEEVIARAFMAAKAEEREIIGKDAWIESVDEDKLVGIVMKLTGGSVNPSLVRDQIENARKRGTN